MSIRCLAVALALLTLATMPSPTSAETINCTPVTTVPFVITTPGVYCFTKSLVTSMAAGTAIDIQANNVVLDLNGHRLGGLAAGLGTTAYGVLAVNRQNVTIRNGTIRGFYRGISLQGSSGSQGHLVEDMRVDQNTFIGILIEGAGSVVRNNQVVSTGGTTISADADAYGIYLVESTGTRVLNNDVTTVVSVGAGVSFGIAFVVGSDGLAVNNRITSAAYGIFYDITGKYRDNLTSNVATPFFGGTDAGNNH